MARQRPGLSNRVHPVVSYEDDVHAWMYFDQVDGVLRYEAVVEGYDERGEPSTLDFVVEEGLFDLACFPAIAALLARSVQRPDGPGSREDGGTGDADAEGETP